jgi:hypothetical protein
MNAASRVPRKRIPWQQQARWASRCLKSNLLQREFAGQHGLCLSTLQRWIAQSRGKAWAATRPKRQPAKTAAAFIEVRAPAASRAWAAEVVRPNGSIIRLAHDAPVPLLQQLLSAC